MKHDHKTCSCLRDQIEKTNHPLFTGIPFTSCDDDMNNWFRKLINPRFESKPTEESAKDTTSQPASASPSTSSRKWKRQGMKAASIGLSVMREAADSAPVPGLKLVLAGLLQILTTIDVSLCTTFVACA